jgi:hypothetical protein
VSSSSARILFASVIVCLFLTLLPSVSATGTNLNITFRETVYQNVTFARDFDLVENRTFSLIVGNITIANPSPETVYDIYVRIINTQYLASNFTFAAGRFGSQKYATKSVNVTTVLTNPITSTFVNIGDIDEDLINDSVRITASNIIFNVSGEYQLLNYTLYNLTGVANLGVAGNRFNNTLINVTSLWADGNYNDGRVYAVLNITGVQTTLNQLVPGEVTLTLTDTNRNYTVLFIPELRPGQNTVFAYNVSSLFVDPPLDINTTYTNPQYQTKVLAGEYFGIQDVACNIATVGALTIVNITIDALNVNVSNASASQIFNFTLHNLTNTGDFANVYGNGTNNRSWYWITNAGTIPILQCFNISYSVRAPDTVPTSGTYPAVQQNLTYFISATASRVGIDDVRARSDLNFTASKQIITPQDNLSNRNVTWRSVPAVSANTNITFTLERVTLWITSTIDPNQISYNLQRNYTPAVQINLSQGWIGQQWLFNFTDGSDNVNAPPPIVWIKPYWIIQNANNQIMNQSFTENGTDTYVKYIYVVNGYWLEVEKNVTSVTNSSYRIQTRVRNIGNGHTPQNLTVTVFDFIPSEFTAYNFSPSFNNASNVSGQFNGIAYQWDVGLRTPIATSFAPRGDASGLDYYYLNYSANGTGNFRVSDLYIVGLDPRKVEGGFAFEGVSIVSAIASTSKELIYLGIVVFLIAINVGNFLMTSRINKKLDKKE